MTDIRMPHVTSTSASVAVGAAQGQATRDRGVQTKWEEGQKLISQALKHIRRECQGNLRLVMLSYIPSDQRLKKIPLAAWALYNIYIYIYIYIIYNES